MDATTPLKKSPYMKEWMVQVDGTKDAPPKQAFTCSKLNIETLEQGVKYAQS